MISNYTDLQAAVIDYTHRADMASRVPTFIQLCEADMQSRLKLVDVESTTTLTVTSGSASLPSDFGGMRACYWDGGNDYPLGYVTPDLYDALDESGTPRFYTILGTTIKVKPVGDGSLTLHYHPRFVGLATTSTNAILTKYPDAYLHGTLAQFHAFTRNPEAGAMHKALYEEAIGRIRAENAQRKWAGPLQVRVR